MSTPPPPPRRPCTPNALIVSASPPPPPPPPKFSPIRASFLPSPRRISSLLTPRKSTPNLRAPVVSPGLDTVEDLTAALAREQALREEAEARVKRTTAEIEELSAALFEQANEMVADERRARARLEERVEVLETRESAKRRRLELLEETVGRMQKAREVLEQQRERECGGRSSEGAEGPTKVDFAAVGDVSKRVIDSETGVDEGKVAVVERRLSGTTAISKATTVTVTEVEVTPQVA
ncbi:hypothetical protein jhhlp_002550 [Lomentospora prolificans]|uniref:GDP/GTP exchange factor Sec2 N-terminal domain-containing protein n=1 Tax=Lomentospora prolificans TaxID=41688 RepID=A0A2N3NEE5_9PEZI|nr:hypothetical protein jhhlp_002550 [Lomentospora prolificans]